MVTADESVPEARGQGGLNTGLLLLKHLLPITEGRVPIILSSARRDVDNKTFEGEPKLLVQKNLPASCCLSGRCSYPGD